MPLLLFYTAHISWPHLSATPTRMTARAAPPLRRHHSLQRRVPGYTCLMYAFSTCCTVASCACAFVASRSATHDAMHYLGFICRSRLFCCTWFLGLPPLSSCLQHQPFLPLAHARHAHAAWTHLATSLPARFAPGLCLRCMLLHTTCSPPAIRAPRCTHLAPHAHYRGCCRAPRAWRGLLPRRLATASSLCALPLPLYAPAASHYLLLPGCFASI